MQCSRSSLAAATCTRCPVAVTAPSRNVKAKAADLKSTGADAGGEYGRSMPSVSVHAGSTTQSNTNRPLVPPLDIPSLLDAVWGTPKARPMLTSLFNMADQAAGPRLYRPDVSSIPGDASEPASAASTAAPADPASLPLLVYLPGIDGTGLAAYRQFPVLRKSFDLQALFIPPEDRSGFETLIVKVKELLQAQVDASGPTRPVYLLGESFGGLLALALAAQMPQVDRVILVNPATSYADSPWPAMGQVLTQLPEPLYKALPIALSPILANPLAMAMHGVRQGAPLPTQASDLAYSLLDMIPELSALRLVLPPETLAWRLRLLKQGAEYMNRRLAKVPQRVLLLLGELDLVIPNRDEAARLTRALPRCQARTLRGRSHAMLQEAGVDLMTILHEEGFYVPVRRLSTDVPDDNGHFHQRMETEEGDALGTQPSSSSSYSSSSDSDSSEPSSSSSSRRIASGFAYGTASPMEVPSRRETEIALDKGGIKLLRRLVSPVYFSTAEDGSVYHGLDMVPTGRRPILLVGNHQLFAPDMPLMVEDFLLEKKTLVRGLAHPFALGQQPSSTVNGGTNNNVAIPNSFGRFLETYGAVPVSGKNMYKLLANGEAVLLYPGGAREAFKNKDEKYKLLWPESQEFVRMAARFGATIVPFAGVGAEDGVNQVLDAKELQAMPVVGEWLRSRQPTVPQARKGVNAGRIDGEETFIQPLVTFNLPSRFYFKFQKPIHTSPALLRDKAAAEEVYAQTRAEVENAIQWLLEKREEDPYKDLATRLLYETTWGGKAAPTFTP